MYIEGFSFYAITNVSSLVTSLSGIVNGLLLTGTPACARHAITTLTIITRRNLIALSLCEDWERNLSLSNLMYWDFIHCFAFTLPNALLSALYSNFHPLLYLMHHYLQQQYLNPENYPLSHHHSFTNSFPFLLSIPFPSAIWLFSWPIILPFDCLHRL